MLSRYVKADPGVVRIGQPQVSPPLTAQALHDPGARRKRWHRRSEGGVRPGSPYLRPRSGRQSVKLHIRGSGTASGQRRGGEWHLTTDGRSLAISRPAKTRTSGARIVLDSQFAHHEPMRNRIVHGYTRSSEWHEVTKLAHCHLSVEEMRSLLRSPQLSARRRWFGRRIARESRWRDRKPQCSEARGGRPAT
jgi:hypothetical protein